MTVKTQASPSSGLSNVADLVARVWTMSSLQELVTAIPNVAPDSLGLQQCSVTFGEMPEESGSSMVFSLPGSEHTAFTTFIFDGMPPHEHADLEFLNIVVNVIGLAIHRLVADRGVSSQLAAIGHEIATYQHQVSRLVGALNLIAGTSRELLADIGHDPLV